LGGGVLLTFSLLSHAAAIGEGVVLAILMDWLHLAGMVAWVGGLIPLAFAVSIARHQPENALPLAFFIPRFSVVALSSVAVLSISGLYSYTLTINHLDLLIATTYGRSLLIKLTLFAILLVLGAVNLFLLSPRLRATGNHMAVSFSRTVRTELIFGILLLLVVGVMTSVAPAKTAWEAHEKLFIGMVREERLDDVQLTLRIAPYQVGDNEFAVDVVDNRPGAKAVEGAILLRLKRLDVDTGILQIETQTEEGQRFTARGSYLSTLGVWELEVIVRRPGFNDVRAKFEFTLPEK
jgi:copper transport protein